MICWSCLGHGYVWLALRKVFWPCPHCEGVPHPVIGPATIKIHAR
jgi:hypothetical protein